MIFIDSCRIFNNLHFFIFEPLKKTEMKSWKKIKIIVFRQNFMEIPKKNTKYASENFFLTLEKKLIFLKKFNADNCSKLIWTLIIAHGKCLNHEKYAWNWFTHNYGSHMILLHGHYNKTNLKRCVKSNYANNRESNQKYASTRVIWTKLMWTNSRNFS